MHIVELDRRVSRASMNGRGVDLTATDLDLLVSLGLIAMLHTAKTEYLGEQARCRHARHHSIAEANTGSTSSAGKTERSVRAAGTSSGTIPTRDAKQARQRVQRKTKLQSAR